MSFIDDCLAGRAKPQNIDDYVEKWFSNDSKALDGTQKLVSLRDFLGMTKKEYHDWLMDGSEEALTRIINAHKKE